MANIYKINLDSEDYDLTLSHTLDFSSMGNGDNNGTSFDGSQKKNDII